MSRLGRSRPARGYKTVRPVTVLGPAVVPVALTAAQVTVTAPAPGVAGAGVRLPAAAQVQAAASAPGPLVTVALPAAAVTVRAPAPSIPPPGVQLTVTLVTAAARPPAVSSGPFTVPAAAVAVRGPAPATVVTVPLPAARVTVTGRAPAAAAGPVTVPAAADTVRAPAPVTTVTVLLPVAQVTVTGRLPGLPAFVNLPAARVTLAGIPAPPPVPVALTTARVTVTGRPPGTVNNVAVLLPPAQASVQAYPPGTPVQHVTVNVNASWSYVVSQPTGFNVPWPVAFAVSVLVANTDRDWMIACCWWRTLPGGSATVSVADDVHNLWLPVGAPAGTSPDGTVRCSVWAAPAARAAGKVIAAASGYVVAVGMTVMDVSGLGSWLSVLAAAATGYNASAGSISATGGPLPGGAEALYVTVGANSDGTSAVSLGGGWTTETSEYTAGGTFVAMSGVTGWATGTAAKTSTYTGPSSSWAACTVMIPVIAAPPPQLQAGWPALQLQAAFGSGAQDPVDTWTWTDISSRFLGGGSSTATRGVQFEMNALQASNITLTLDNNDMALSPVNTVSPYYPDVQVDTPVRLLATWRGRSYCLWSGFAERWPEQWEDGTRYGLSPVTVTDAWSMLTGQMLSITRETYLTLMPSAYWPLGDPAQTTENNYSCANIVPGNTIPLVITQSKNGPGSGTWSLGNGTWLWPDSSGGSGRSGGGTVWQQSGLTAVTVNHGYNLLYSDPGMPGLAGGVSFTVWFGNNATVYANQNVTVMRVTGPAGPIFELAISNPNAGSGQGNLLVTTWNGTTRVSTTSTIDTFDWLVTGFNPLFVAILTPTSWTVYTDGYGDRSPYSGSASFATGPAWLEFAGLTDRFASGQFYNGEVAHAAVFPRALNVADSMALYESGVFAFVNESPAGRATRLLSYSGYMGPRMIDVTAQDDALAPSASLTGTQAGTAISAVAQGSLELLYVDGNDVITLQRRADSWNQPVRWVLGENAAAVLNANWAFTSGTSPWTASGGTLTAVTSPRFHPWYAAALTPTGSAATAALVSEAVPVTAGTSYRAGMQVYSAGGYGDAQAQVTWLNSGGGTISVTSGRTALLPPGAWTWMEVTGAAPAGAVTARFGPAETGTPDVSAVLVLGEAVLWPASAEYPYESDISVSFDKQQLYNDAQLTTIGPAGQSEGPVIVQNPASITQHGDFVYQVTSTLNDPAQVIDSGQWLVNTAGDPQLRVDQVTVNAGANPFNTEFVLGVEVGDIVTLNRRPQGAAQPLSLLLQVITVKKTVDWKSGTLQAQCALNPYPGGSVLSADDPVHGLLNGNNLLPW